MGEREKEMPDRQRLVSHQGLEVYQLAFRLAMRIFEMSRMFPREETYSLTDQVRRASRSVCANIVEAWRKRRYRAAFVSRLSDAETEAAETQVWTEFAVACAYLAPSAGDEITQEYNHVIAMLITMINHPEDWTIRSEGK
jgi:four helix bundle protein